MNHLFTVLKLLPLTAAITGTLYYLVYQYLKKRRARPDFFQMIVEFALLGWMIVFIYITQLMSFGNGLGEPLNLSPLKPIYLAIKYGAENGGMVDQILLNLLMFVPLGFLLPLVFKKTFNNFLAVFSVSFALTFFTEVSQFVTGRHGDIDDIIANTMGGLLGFVIYVVGNAVLNLIRIGMKAIRERSQNDRLNFAVSLFVILLTLSPYAVIRVLESNNEFGFVYYGHLTPAHIDIPAGISEDETTANVYQNTQIETYAELASRLVNITGFTCTFVELGSGTHQCREEGSTKAIFIYPYNTWSVLYNYGESVAPLQSSLPTEAEAVALSKAYLETFQISPGALDFDGLDQGFSDGNLHLTFSDNTSTKDQVVWGTIDLTLGENGKLLSIADRRTYHHYFSTIELITPRKAVEVARDIGVGEWNGTAVISDIEPSYYFNEKTGFLIPTWQIHGQLIGDQGQNYAWSPNIDARK